MDIYKCPKSISEFTFGNQKSTILYILLIFLLKEIIDSFLFDDGLIVFCY
jgi:hypothetical protein